MKQQVENAFTRKPAPMSKDELRLFNSAATSQRGGLARAKQSKGVAVLLSGTKPERKPK
jgi:hypothetical protein